MLRPALFLLPFALPTAALCAEAPTPLFHRHVTAVFSKLGCNGGNCHGAVQGKAGFRLALFAADTAIDYAQVVRGMGGRRLNLIDPASSLLLLKPSGRVPHGGGLLLETDSPEYEVLRRWIAAGARDDDPARSRTRRLTVEPAEQVVPVGGSYRLKVRAEFTDGTAEDVTHLCAFESRDRMIAEVSPDGQVRGVGVGDAAVMVRYRAEPITALAVVPRASERPFPAVAGNNFVDRHILDKLRRLNVPPAELADDGTFIRRAYLDVCGELPTPEQTKAFLVDTDPKKREKLIDELLARPGHAALWTLKFCDLLKASDYGVYADGIRQEVDAPRFQAWVRARLEENLRYDEFVERILTAASRDGKSFDEWTAHMTALAEGYRPGRPDLKLYADRRTPDAYWQRRNAGGVAGALQAAHAFLGLRLDCAQCHRHPHDVWQQNDLLEFANFFTRVSRVGFNDSNEKKRPDAAAFKKRVTADAKQAEAESKRIKDGELKKLDAQAKANKAEIDRLTREIAKTAGAQADELKKKLETAQAAAARHDELKRKAGELDRRSKMLPEVVTRVLHSEIYHVADARAFASVTSPLGTQKSERFRLLGSPEPVEVKADQDPRALVAAWMRRPDNPWFARAIVNRVWAHYMGRGLIDPPDHLSVFNPATHPGLLKELCDRFIADGYDLRKLHRNILTSRTYQQSSLPAAGAENDKSNYAAFTLRRLPAEVLADALDQVTGVKEKLDMASNFWPDHWRVVEAPFRPRNDFVNYVLTNFGKPARNSAQLCDCERDAGTGVLQVLGLANHPRLRQKIADPNGRAAAILKAVSGDDARIDEVYLAALSRRPDAAEREACRKYLREAGSPAEGVQGVLWSLINTREFLLQH